MPVIKHANTAEFTREAIVLDLGDLRLQGERMIAEAGRAGEAIVRDAKAERDRLVAGAAERGYAEGLARGEEAGRLVGAAEGRAAALVEHAAVLAGLERGWTDALASFIAGREGMVHGAKSDVLRLACAVAEKVTKRTVEIDERVVADQLAAVLELIVRPTALRVWINPADRPVAEAAFPGLLARFETARHAQLLDDPALGRGSCVVRGAGGERAGRDQARGDQAPGDQAQNPSGGGSRGGDGHGGFEGEIDATIDTQLDRIIEAILPRRARHAPGGVGDGHDAGGAAP